jgi:hypothetical protein
MTGVSGSRAAAHRWLVFHAKSGFRVSYPADWHRAGGSPNMLDLTSSSRRVEAVVIPAGAQEIYVREAQPVPGDDYVGEFRRRAPGDKVLRVYDIIFPKRGRTRAGCSTATVIEYTDEVGPHTNYLIREMYCKIGSRLFVLFLTQWEDDKPSKAAARIARRMVDSITLQ